MMCYAVLMFILVCSHATIFSAVNSQEKTLLQHGEHITTNLYEEIQDAEEWLTSVNEARTLQSTAGEKKAIPAEPLKPGYKVCVYCRCTLYRLSKCVSVHLIELLL